MNPHEKYSLSSKARRTKDTLFISLCASLPLSPVPLHDSPLNSPPVSCFMTSIVERGDRASSFLDRTEKPIYTAWGKCPNICRHYQRHLLWIYYVCRRKDFEISLALRRDSNIMIILVKFEISTSTYIYLVETRRVDIQILNYQLF